MANRQGARMPEQGAYGLALEPVTSQGFSFYFASSFFERVMGLLRGGLCMKGEVLVLTNCRSIHTFGMRSTLDVAFIDRQGKVLKSVRGLQSRRVLACREAVAVLERRCVEGKEGSWLKEGDVVKLLSIQAESI